MLLLSNAAAEQVRSWEFPEPLQCVRPEGIFVFKLLQVMDDRKVGPRLTIDQEYH